ncbi:hypothetical protein GGF32_009771 [Allomyces javanicus]|nr:hypothetical protein GGF32_009771 [Allomyces javanicus]
MRRRISQLTGGPPSAAAVRPGVVRDDAVQHAKYMAALRTCLRPHGGATAPVLDPTAAGGETTIAVVDKKGNVRAVPRYAATHAQLRAAKNVPAQASPKRAVPPPRRPVEHEDPWSARAVRGVSVASAVRRGKRDAGSDEESDCDDDGGGPLNASSGVKSMIAAVSAASAAASARTDGAGPGRRRRQYILATQATDSELKRQIMDGGSSDTARGTTSADSGRRSRTASEPASSSPRRPSTAGPWPLSLSSAALAALETHPIARSPDTVDLLAAEAAKLPALAALIKAPTGLGRGKKDKELMDPVRQLCEVATMLRRAPGAAVVKQGEMGTQWCVVVRGAAEVSVAMHNMPTARVKVAEVGFGYVRGERRLPHDSNVELTKVRSQGFGELALVNSTPRAATVTALPPPTHPPNTPFDDACDTLFLAIDKADYLRLVRTQHQRDLQAKVAFLASVPAMAQAAGIAATSTNTASAPMGQLAGVAAVASWRTWPKSSTLVKEGQPVREFFFIRRGTVDVFRSVEVVDRGQAVRRHVRVASKGPGEYFGEEWVVRWSVSDYLSQYVDVLSALRISLAPILTGGERLDRWAHEHTKTARQRLMSISAGVTTPSMAPDATTPSSPPTTRELPSFTSRITARAVGGPVEVLAMGIFDAQCRCTNKLPVAEYDAFDATELKRLYEDGKRAAEWHRTRAAVLRGIGMAPAPRAADAAAGPVDEVGEEVESGEGGAAT